MRRSTSDPEGSYRAGECDAARAAIEPTDIEAWRLLMQQLRNRTRVAAALVVIASALAATALAQQPDATRGAAIATQPGKADIARTVEISAEITGIDKATRTLTLKGPQGNSIEIVAGDGVKRFDELT
jgi:hypothetical protein